MPQDRRTWLVINPASGSNSDEAVSAVESELAAAGCAVDRKLCFPQHPLPTPSDLRAAAVDLVVVYTGDGTINALVTALYGWEGAILVLPGGTMNLLSLVLHGEAEPREIIARLAAGAPGLARPPVVRSARGDGLAGILAGPGTAWNGVREALRAGDVVEVVREAAAAITESAAGTMVACDAAHGARDEGYALLMLTPQPEGIVVEGYYAQTIADYARQGLALLKRNFREGPHDDLGTVSELTCRLIDGAPLDLLIDGEPTEGGRTERFALARCEVDLICTLDA